MIVLDAYAVIAYLHDEPAAGNVTKLLRQEAGLTSVNLVEVVDHLVRVRNRHVDYVHADLALLEHSGVRILPVHANVGLLAGELRAKWCHRERMPLSLADCVAAACALHEDAPLATSDPPLATLVRAEGGQVIGLPDRSGRSP